jgi:hypothetical protein
MYNHPTIVRALAEERRARLMEQAEARIWRKPIRPRHRFRKT